MKPNKCDFPAEYPCLICGELRPLLLSKKSKPYFICNPCGVQVFIRGKLGLDRLSEIKNNTELWDKINSLAISDSSNLLRLNQRIEILKSEINKIEISGFINGSDDDESRHMALSNQLNKLETEYYRELLPSEDSEV